MELRHLRYFVAIAETGSLTLAAEKRLHTAQPSLSRQIRDLEHEVGVQLLTRSPQGTALTAAGRAFLDHARLSLSQAEAATEAARRAARPAKIMFSIGFLTGQEVDWLPHAPGLLQDELPKIELKVLSNFSTNLADDLQRGKLDVAFLRREQKPDLEYRLVRKEELVVIFPNDHALAKNKTVNPRALLKNAFIGISDVAPVLRTAIHGYLNRSGLEIVPAVEIDNYSMAISLVTSTKGVAMLPESIIGYLPPSITSRPMAGSRPTVDLVLGYHKANTSPILKIFLSKIDALAARIYKERKL
ncbi:MAG: LysR family transcriptional regulator [Xanthobacteraceae bacterium]|nr:LysR family transcriptional regulator [Xanthobacteraceae bacterium]